MAFVSCGDPGIVAAGLVRVLRKALGRARLYALPVHGDWPIPWLCPDAGRTGSGERRAAWARRSVGRGRNSAAVAGGRAMVEPGVRGAELPLDRQQDRSGSGQMG